MNKKVSDQLVETLVETGIQRIYTVTGDSLNHVNAAVHRNGKIKWIRVRHEETAAYAAGAVAHLNGLACCAGSSGPGHVHFINGGLEYGLSEVRFLSGLLQGRKA